MQGRLVVSSELASPSDGLHPLPRVNQDETTSMDSDGGSSSDREVGPSGPHHQGKSKGWDGDHLELEHQRKQAEETSTQHHGEPVAVDLEQFRNTEVGKGYQARHVIRQPRVATAAAELSTSSTTSRKIAPAPDSSSSRTHQGGTSNISQGKRPASPSSTPHDPKLDKYLRCEALRKFRRELDQILD